MGTENPGPTKPASVVVRTEKPEDRGTIRLINEAAFGTSDEADLIDSLRQEGTVLVSFVAEVENRIVGHILFSRMTIETADASVWTVALAPMAVLPECQRQWYWRAVIRHGLEWLRQQGEQIVIGVGHADYYPRFGFSTEKATSLTSPFPPEFFMALDLKPGALNEIRGEVRYPKAFGLMA